MATRSVKKSPSDYPQSTDTWLFAIRKLRIWVEMDNATVRPFFMFVVNLDKDLIQAWKFAKDLKRQEALEFLFQSMTQPRKELKVKPGRPARIIFEDRQLMNDLTPDLNEMGIAVDHRPESEDIDTIIKSFEEHLREGVPQVPGLFSQKNVDENLVQSLFSAAADFYRAEPWVQLGNDDVLAIEAPFRKKPFYVVVMGQGGVEYGLSLFLRWEDVERMFQAGENFRDIIPSTGAHSLLFVEMTKVPFDDLEAVESSGWEVAGPEAYPVPLVIKASGEVSRPSREVILLYEAALRAIPKFAQEHLTLDASGQIQPCEVDIPVSLSSGQATIHIKFPAGDLTNIVGQPGIFKMEDEDLPGDLPMILNRRAMEGDMARKFGMFEDRYVDPKLRKAQEMMYQAWNEPNPAKRIAMARKALSISENCADAYVLLAEEEADTVERALSLYRQGVEAGERALGQEYFRENAGQFWGLLETRPYMRAMQGMAAALWQLGRNDEALKTYREMLRLNPDDNQGIRYALADLLLLMNREAELEALLQEYHREESAVWLYTQALLAFRKAGASEAANRALRKAMRENPYAPDYLIGKKRIPNRLPDMIGFGDDSEAVSYAARHLNYWLRTPGAVNWLKDQLAQKTGSKHSRGGNRGKARRGKTLIQPGDSVVVHPGVVDPDYGQDLGGWQGRVVEIDDEGPERLVTISWDSQTLQQMPVSMIEQCEEDELNWSQMILSLDEVSKVQPRDTLEERDAVYRKLSNLHAWDYLGEQGRRIRSVLENIDAEDDRAALQAWESFLRARLEFPFDAVLADVDYGNLRIGAQLKVIGIARSDEEEGILVQVEKGRTRHVIPLYPLEITEERSANAAYVDDYQTWHEERLM